MTDAFAGTDLGFVVRSPTRDTAATDTLYTARTLQALDRATAGRRRGYVDELHRLWRPGPVQAANLASYSAAHASECLSTARPRRTRP